MDQENVSVLPLPLRMVPNYSEGIWTVPQHRTQTDFYWCERVWREMRLDGRYYPAHLAEKALVDLIFSFVRTAPPAPPSRWLGSFAQYCHWPECHRMIQTTRGWPEFFCDYCAVGYTFCGYHRMESAFVGYRHNLQACFFCGRWMDGSANYGRALDRKSSAEKERFLELASKCASGPPLPPDYAALVPRRLFD